jgi:hypothetical protein
LYEKVDAGAGNFFGLKPRLRATQLESTIMAFLSGALSASQARDRPT